MFALSSSCLNALRATMPTGSLLTEKGQLCGYGSDGLGYKHYLPDAVAIPGNVEELLNLAALLRKEKIPIIPRGAGTSLSGGPVAAEGGVIIHFSKLREIEHISTEDRVAVVQSGVVLNHLNMVLQDRGLYYPPDPSTGAVCTLGGNVASNSGGVHCFRYGVTSNYVLGVEVLLPDGSLRKFGGPAGGRGAWREDWKRLFVGSEGTLGLMIRFWLRLIPLPEKIWTFRASFSNVASVSSAIQALASHPAYPAAIELMDPRCVDMVESSSMRVGLPKGSFMLLTEIDGPPELVDGRVSSIAKVLSDCGGEEVSWSDQAEPRKKLWQARKAQGGLLAKMSSDYIVQDAVIPKACLAEMLNFIYQEADAGGIPVITIMHAGDGNLHPNLLFDANKEGDLERVEEIGKKLMGKVSELGGTLSGEHGIGNDKSAYVEGHFGPLGNAMQLTISRVFDERCQFNPQKIFPERKMLV